MGEIKKEVCVCACVHIFLYYYCMLHFLEFCDIYSLSNSFMTNICSNLEL